MNVRRLSLVFSVAGGALLMAATTVLVSISLGRVGTTTMGADGNAVYAEFSTPSIMEDSPGTAVGWIAATAVFVVIVALLIRYGGFVGPILVFIVLQLLVLVSILSIGIFLAAGTAAFCASALLAISDRSTRRAREHRTLRLESDDRLHLGDGCRRDLTT